MSRRVGIRQRVRPPVDRLRAICLALPEATEQIAWGEPTWRVRGKLFAQLDDHHHGADLAQRFGQGREARKRAVGGGIDVASEHETLEHRAGEVGDDGRAGGGAQAHAQGRSRARARRRIVSGRRRFDSHHVRELALREVRVDRQRGQNFPLTKSDVPFFETFVQPSTHRLARQTNPKAYALVKIVFEHTILLAPSGQ